MTENTAPDPEGVSVTNPYEIVRVKTSTGGHASVNRVTAVSRGYTILEGRPATDAYGRPLAGKPKADLTPLDIKGPFDPSGKTVAQVTAYLDTAEPAEITRVLTAEASGQGRSKIASWAPAAAASTDQTPEA